MASATINLIGEVGDPRVDVHTLPENRRFITLAFADGSSLILPGFDAGAAKFATKLADALNEAAAQIDIAIDEAPATDRGF